MTEARSIGEIIRGKSFRRSLRAMAHLTLRGCIAPPLSADGKRLRRKQRRDRLMGWVEVCPRCKAVECQCAGLRHV